MRSTLPRFLLTVVLVLGMVIIPMPAPAVQAQSIAPTLESYTLDNGLRVLLAPRPGSPVTILNVWVGTGSVNETPETAGISHFFEHMVFKGTDTRPGTVDLEIENLGGRTNASTSLDWTQYYITVPSENALDALEILADITVNSNFPEEEILAEKDVVLREMDQRQDNPNAFLAFKLYEEWYDVHPYGLPIIGYPESLEALTRDDFMAYMETWYVPGNMVVVIVGDFDSDEMLAHVDATLGQMEAREAPPRDYPAEPPLEETRIVEFVRDFNQGYLHLAWPAPSVDDIQDVYAMDVLLGVLSMGRSSRFYKNIFRDLGIVNSVNAGYFTLVDNSIFSVSASFPYERRSQVEDAVLHELGRILDGDLTAGELERAKTILISRYVLSSESVSGLAGTLGFYAIVAGDHEFALNYPDGIGSVTLSDLQAAAQKYIDLDRYLELVLIPESYAEPEPVEILPEGNTLDNGLMIILHEDSSSDVVAIQSFVGTGTLVESAEQAGIATLTQRLMLKGTESRSEDALFEALEDLGSQLSQSMLADMGNITLVATGSTLEDALPLYLDVLLHPAFQEADLAQVKDETLRAISARSDDNFTVLYDNLLSGLYGDTGYGRPDIGTVDSIQSIAVDDVVDFYGAYYVPNNMVISVVGNIDAPALYRQLEAALGGLEPSAEPLERPELDLELTDNSQVVADRASNLTWMMLGFPAPPVNSPDYPAMKVLNAVVGGGFSSRLFRELRAEQGLAYSTGALYPSRAEDSHLGTYIITLPDNAALARDGLLAILQDIQENGVSADELERAQNFVVGDFAIEHDTASRRAWYLGWFEMLGVGAGYDEVYPEAVRAVTSADLQRVAQTYLNNYVFSVIGPSPEE